MPMDGWAIDLGNSHTRVARWDECAATPHLLELPEICRQPGGIEPLAAPQLIPSATEIIDTPTWRARFGSRPFVAKRWFIGRLALIGRPALQRNTGSVFPNFAPAFKPYLGREALRPLCRVGKRSYTAREVACLFVRELLAEIKRATGVRIRDLVLTTPVDAYETYRAELLRIAKSLGVKRLRFIDEPVAAALGYGLGLTSDRRVLVVDFGGGTLHFALVTLTAAAAEAGTAKVIAKEGKAVGGNLVDEWLLTEFCRQLGYPLEQESTDEELTFWRQFTLAEARRVKEAVFFKPSEVFQLTPPAYLRRAPEAAPGEPPWLTVTRERLVTILEQHDLYGILEGSLENILYQASDAGLDEQNIEEILLVGGSTLLPGVYPFFEKRFGRDRVRAWQPFQAVAYGACTFAAHSLMPSDFIVHDYAFVTFDPTTHEKQYTVIVPHGTRFPTAPHFWRRQLVPTCALGEPETMFKLVVCELGCDGTTQERLIWDKEGQLHRVGPAKPVRQPVVVPLNETNPTLGRLAPPHSPRDRRPRLEVSFSVNSDRWLCATVLDLKTRRPLLEEARVVRLL